MLVYIHTLYFSYLLVTMDEVVSAASIAESAWPMLQSVFRFRSIAAVKLVWQLPSFQAQRRGVPCQHRFSPYSVALQDSGPGRRAHSGVRWLSFVLVECKSRIRRESTRHASLVLEPESHCEAACSLPGLPDRVGPGPLSPRCQARSVKYLFAF